METFLDQPGVPLVSAELVDHGKAVRLTQRRFANAGVVAPPTVWQIPVSLKYTDGGPMQTKTVLLTQRTQDFKLEAANPPSSGSTPRGPARLLPLERGAAAAHDPLGAGQHAAGAARARRLDREHVRPPRRRRAARRGLLPPDRQLRARPEPAVVQP